MSLYSLTFHSLFSIFVLFELDMKYLAKPKVGVLTVSRRFTSEGEKAESL